MVGGEFQWGAIERMRSTASTPNDFRIQLTARFNYSLTLMPDKEKNDGK